FDAYEPVVEKLGDFLVLERLPLHDMTPVAGAVADREEDEFLLLLGPGKRLRAPGIPVHGVVGVLPEVWAGFLGEAVGVLRFALGRLGVEGKRKAAGRQQRCGGRERSPVSCEN